jgi:hypothetical protein
MPHDGLSVRGERLKKGLVMRKLIGWTLLSCANGLLFWQIVQSSSRDSVLAAGIMIAVFNLLVGVRAGFASRDQYARDLARLNQFLVDQNEQLTLSNRELLERCSASRFSAATFHKPDEVARARATS